jgi:hypothetical protein
MSVRVLMDEIFLTPAINYGVTDAREDEVVPYVQADASDSELARGLQDCGQERPTQFPGGSQ